jgi:hypothetical protein
VIEGDIAGYQAAFVERWGGTFLRVADQPLSTAYTTEHVSEDIAQDVSTLIDTSQTESRILLF